MQEITGLLHSLKEIEFIREFMEFFTGHIVFNPTSAPIIVEFTSKERLTIFLDTTFYPIDNFSLNIGTFALYSNFSEISRNLKKF